MEPVRFVETIKERCRNCYTCVRECPAKAIRISTGQAEVLAERCIGCGNCVRVCSQSAKKILGSLDIVEGLLADKGPVAACLAPSFPAEFADIPPERLVGMLRRLGFHRVHEVSFGADLVAEAYRRLFERSEGKRYIAATCPAIIGYVERYYPELVPNLAPIVSPMVATARVLKRLYGPDMRVVFIGPCIAKKGELISILSQTAADAAIVFVELRELFDRHGVKPGDVESSDFDPPRGGLGGLFSISGGLLQAAAVGEDLLTGHVVAAEGRTGFVQALREFASGDLDARLLEVLCCDGCIMGAGMSADGSMSARRTRVREYVCARPPDRAATQREMERFADVDLSRTYAANDQRLPVSPPKELSEVLARMGKFTPEDELNCGACGYDTCREHAIATLKGLAESEMCLPHTIEQLRRAVRELALSNSQLEATQEALMDSEKMASMGRLAAGIAHELNNPLGVVLMYAHMLQEAAKDSALRDDLSLISEQADRCRGIVAGLLHFARQNKAVLEPTDLHDLVERALRSAPAPENVTVAVQDDLTDREADLDRNQMIQVLTNLFSNAYAAMPDGGRLTIRLASEGERVQIIVSDTGCGIPPENLKRVFEPFFTTKPIGKGTGLGLAVSYGIVKMHKGDIRLESNADPKAGPTGATFTIVLPRREARIDAAPREWDGNRQLTEEKGGAQHG